MKRGNKKWLQLKKQIMILIFMIGTVARLPAQKKNLKTFIRK